MKRPSQVSAPAKGKWSCPDAAFAKKYPSLAQGMCDGWWEDGKQRDVWSVTLRFDDSGVFLCINDKGLNSGLYTSGATLDDALALVEACLTDGSASWRRWKK